MNSERKKALIVLRDKLLSAQIEHSKLEVELAPAKKIFEEELERVENNYKNAYGDVIEKMKNLSELASGLELNIRDIIKEEWDSLSEEEKETERSIWKPWLGVSVKETFAIRETAKHDTILEDVKNNYPYLLTYDRDKLLKQAEVYTPEERVVKMPYIQRIRKVSATIKKTFWTDEVTDGQEASS